VPFIQWFCILEYVEKEPVNPALPGVCVCVSK